MSLTAIEIDLYIHVDGQLSKRFTMFQDNIEVLDSSRDALRDRWDASKHDSKLLQLAASDNLGNNSDTKQFNITAAIPSPYSTSTKI